MEKVWRTVERVNKKIVGKYGMSALFDVFGKPLQAFICCVDRTFLYLGWDGSIYIRFQESIVFKQNLDSAFKVRKIVAILSDVLQVVLGVLAVK